MPALAELRFAVLEAAKATFVLVPQSVLIHVFIQSLPLLFLRALTAYVKPLPELAHISVKCGLK